MTLQHNFEIVMGKTRPNQARPKRVKAGTAGGPHHDCPFGQAAAPASVATMDSQDIQVTTHEPMIC